MRRIEDETAARHGTSTNFFQQPFKGLTAPEMVAVRRRNSGDVELTWGTGYAGASPIVRYEVHRKGVKLLSRPFEPLTSETPFDFMDNSAAPGDEQYFVRVVDAEGKTADSKTVKL
jgi:hypothetical protein